MVSSTTMAAASCGGGVGVGVGGVRMAGVLPLASLNHISIVCRSLAPWRRRCASTPTCSDSSPSADPAPSTSTAPAASMWILVVFGLHGRAVGGAASSLAICSVLEEKQRIDRVGEYYSFKFTKLLIL
ncbi:uncharacterized protein LOC110429551 isoform X1 [Sorghum bicolor]|uniref:uncharacterized protein LOC110429551 isoform X1 n=1 Tax=Sorghum bicolor TaxID=4558 RepID=UPI000B423EFF|nr:uncharacterized protein LOC110429551 isoform X1 [Sorghum bicolor]|eukprot:XP_021301286.1 uncharacterized protein LOC110429551 isoform X1 [Sorghum bicolor]